MQKQSGPKIGDTVVCRQDLITTGCWKGLKNVGPGKIIAVHDGKRSGIVSVKWNSDELTTDVLAVNLVRAIPKKKGK